MGIVVSSQQASNIFWHLVTCLNAICVLISRLHQLLPQEKELPLCLSLTLSVSLSPPPPLWCLYYCTGRKYSSLRALITVCPLLSVHFFKCFEISGNNGTDKYLFIHTLLSPGVRLRWKLRELDKNSGISKKEATNEQSGRSNFFPVHGAGIVFIWVRRQIIFHVDDTW